MISAQLGRSLIQILRDTAAAEIMPRYRRLSPDSIKTKTTPTDLVTIADECAETKIREEIVKLMPGVAVVGEEAVTEDAAILDRIRDTEVVAIIDPIDGTWNYANGLPVFGIILAIVEHGKTSFGVLYDPVMDDWIYAHEGEGAHYLAADDYGCKIQVSKAKKINEMTGFLPLFLFDKRQQSLLSRKLNLFDRVLSLRCSCHEYRLLSEGSTDFYLTGSLKPWDHAAGELIYREAGGYSGLMADGAPYSPNETSGQLLLAPTEASWNKLHEQFKDIFSGGH